MRPNRAVDPDVPIPAPVDDLLSATALITAVLRLAGRAPAPLGAGGEKKENTVTPAFSVDREHGEQVAA
ncbi:hypothetical protein ACFYZE_35180 [Streptomyces sp. NPDC001796]|uniref:hypothetical protein n=1 Tax=Streptomyces sp. NPDC001796 TaxID=3364609 RepID=UPI0036929FAA